MTKFKRTYAWKKNKDKTCDLYQEVYHNKGIYGYEVYKVKGTEQTYIGDDVSELSPEQLQIKFWGGK